MKRTFQKRTAEYIKRCSRHPSLRSDPILPRTNGVVSVAEYVALAPWKFAKDRWPKIYRVQTTDPCAWMGRGVTHRYVPSPCMAFLPPFFLEPSPFRVERPRHDQAHFPFGCDARKSGTRRRFEMRRKVVPCKRVMISDGDRDMDQSHARKATDKGLPARDRSGKRTAPWSREFGKLRAPRSSR